MNFTKFRTLVFAIFTMWHLSSACFSQSESFIQTPGKNEILDAAKRTHPRLLAGKDDFQQLASNIKTNQLLAEWYKKIHIQGEKILNEPPSTYEIPDGLRLLATSRRILERIYILGLLYQIDHNPQWKERAWLELQAASKFPDWNPRHFLDTAEMAHAFAIGYDWFFHSWTGDQRSTLKNAMVDKGIKLAYEILEKNISWAKVRHNWNQVCNGGIGMAALAILEDEPELCSKILIWILQSIQLPMSDYAPDGAWVEGPGYWDYATSYNTVFLAALFSVLDSDFGLSQLPGFDVTGDFPIYITSPINRTFNYADGSDSPIRAPCLLWLSKHFKKPEYAYYQIHHAKPHPLDLLWYQSLLEPPKPYELETAKLFKHAEIAVFRTSWTNTNAIFVAFKAGDNKVNHSHLDVGTFVMDAQGERWAVDLGADNYNLPGYFGNQRWSYYRLRAEGHNTVVINPDHNPDQDPTASTKIIKFQSSNDRAFAIADLSPAYKIRLSSFKRGVSIVNKQTIIIQDEISAEAPVQFYWFMHTPAKIEIEKSGNLATLSQNNKSLLARILEPKNATFEIMDAKPLPSSPNPPAQAKNTNIRKLSIHMQNISNLRVVVQFTPKVEDSTRHPEIEVLPLSSW